MPLLQIFTLFLYEKHTSRKEKQYICGIKTIINLTTKLLRCPKTKKTMKALNYFATFLCGVVIGSAAGILLAPEKGSETRERIAEALRKRGIRLNRKDMNALVDDITEELSNQAEAAE